MQTKNDGKNRNIIEYYLIFLINAEFLNLDLHRYQISNTAEK